MRLPPLSGRPIRVEIRKSLGPHWAATNIRKRVIQLDAEVLRQRGEFERILIHELFHFVWVRLGNPKRLDWEELVRGQLRAKGELGWSSEWRKEILKPSDAEGRSRAWRRYACESFCDSAAWLFSGVRHEEFTLAVRSREPRHRWFNSQLSFITRV